MATQPGRKRLRLLGAGVVVAAAIGAGAVAPGSPAAAANFVRSGWWNAANNGTVAPPAPPDVPDGGLAIQGGPSGPGAFGAVAFDLGGRELANSLKLEIAGTPTPNLAVKACVIPSGDFTSGSNQPMSTAPTYDCDHVQAIAGTVGADGTISFDLSALATGSRLALAILPAGTTDRAATQTPDSSSLQTRPGVEENANSSAPAEPAPDTSSTNSAAAADAGASSYDTSSGATPSYGSSSSSSPSSPSLSSNFDSGASISMTTPASPADVAPAAPAPAGNTEAAAPPAPIRRAAAAAGHSDLATKVGGLMALALLFAAMAAYVRGYGLMGGRVAD